MQESSRCNGTDTFLIRFNHVMHLSKPYVPDFERVQLRFVVVVDIRGDTETHRIARFDC